MSHNADQIEFWNGIAGERWAKFHAQLDRGMEKIADALFAFAQPRPGERVLDIGCGCGTTTLRLAGIVGSSGGVTAVDISKPMLAVAAARAKEAKLRIRFIEDDVSEVRFTPEHHLSFSRFGVMFFADPVASFANIRRALKRGGRLAFVCWRTLPENTWAALPQQIARPFLPPSPPADPLAPGPFAYADRERVMAVLRESGFSDIRIEKLDTVMWMGADVEEAATQALSIGPLARSLIDADEALRAKVRAAVKAKIKDFTGPSGVAPPAACWLVGAKNA